MPSSCTFIEVEEYRACILTVPISATVLPARITENDIVRITEDEVTRIIEN